MLRRAEVVVYDRLSVASLLDLAPAGAERINVGKDPAGASVPQEHINELLVEHGQAGRCVVRLKGGDPFVFGGGGLELRECFPPIPGLLAKGRRIAIRKKPNLRKS